MSQEKVNRYKEEKAKRQELIKKQKQKALITKIVAAVICLGLVGWLGYSAYVTINGPIRNEYTVDIEPLNDYLATLTEEEEDLLDDVSDEDGDLEDDADAEDVSEEDEAADAEDDTEADEEE